MLKKIGMPFSYLIKTSSDTQTYALGQKIILSKLYFRQYYISRKIALQGSVCVLRIRIRIRVIQKRPDPTGSRSATLIAFGISSNIWEIPPRRLKFLATEIFVDGNAMPIPT